MSDKFDEILAKSQRLTTQLGIDSDNALFNQPLRRGIHELESSRNIGLGSKHLFEEQDKLNAVRLLAQKNFDAVKLSSEVRDIHVETPYDRTSQLEDVDIESYLAHHHDMIVLNAVDDSIRLTEDFVKHSQRKRLADEWQISRKKFIESLGNVTQHWNGQVSSTSNAEMSILTNVTPVKMFLPYKTSNFLNLQSTATPGKSSYQTNKSNPSSMLLLASTTHDTSTSVISKNGAIAGSNQLSEILKKHANVVRKLNVNLKSTQSAQLFNKNVRNVPHVSPVAELAESIVIATSNVNTTREIESNGLSKADLIGYKSVLEMMSSMVGESSFPFITPGLYSPLCFGSYISIGNNNSMSQQLPLNIHMKKLFLSIGAMKYLERQQLLSFNIEIDENIQKGFIEQIFVNDGIEGISRCQKLRSFIHHLHRTGYLYDRTLDERIITMTSDNMNNSMEINRGVNLSKQSSLFRQDKAYPLWPYIYYCLICGDWDMAIQELKACIFNGIPNVESEIVIVLQYFQYFLSKYVNLSTTTKSNVLNEATVSEIVKGEKSIGHGDLNRILNLEESKEFYKAFEFCKELYERDVSSSSADPYRVLLLNLVSLSDKTVLSDPGISALSYTLQNYLWANCWFMVFERYAMIAINGPYSLVTSYSDDNISRRSDKAEEKIMEMSENWLYSAVLDYGGEDHFDSARNNPMKYVTVLLVCQRFGDAIVHLWQSTRTLPAVHLAVLCLHYGLILPHLPLVNNPSFNHITTNRDVVANELTPSSILSFFFNDSFQCLFPEIAVDYFLHLNSNWLPSMQINTNIVPNDSSLALKEPSSVYALLESHVLRCKGIVSSVFETFLMNLRVESLVTVVGEVPTIERPSTGYLHEYMSSEMINLLLVRCAYHLLQTKLKPDAAIHFYKLSGRFTDALDELCNQLSLVVLSKNIKASDRTYWMKESINFFERYVTSGIGPFADCLQKDNRNDLIQTFLHLLNISTFMDAYVDHQYMDAINILEEISFLPTVETQLQVCALPVLSKNMSIYLQRLLDDFLLCVVDCLTQGYRQYGDELQSLLLTVIQRNELKLKMERMSEKVNVIAKFVTDISLYLNRGDTLHQVITASQQLQHIQQRGATYNNLSNHNTISMINQ